MVAYQELRGDKGQYSATLAPRYIPTYHRDAWQDLRPPTQPAGSGSPAPISPVGGFLHLRCWGTNKKEQDPLSLSSVVWPSAQDILASEGLRDPDSVLTASLPPPEHVTNWARPAALDIGDPQGGTGRVSHGDGSQWSKGRGRPLGWRLGACTGGKSVTGGILTNHHNSVNATTIVNSDRLRCQRVPPSHHLEGSGDQLVSCYTF